ncbi:hypothetical protein EF847_16785 [Actinobacteria bacterium YIM 96077]|uniref:Uncharacterized protein n=1 Tax=Phytoactinopolyspora halophila TaxID=1981511 RepID=A0A329QC21_9ACTN|nr:hypothetical protein [Phytoactinopolyspora halophila]AYY14109.1 hypothetical protein EF847_16785 [Actinobacteria bacterium YIM 96077]RAW09955.1 hypothetical protein DPM12_19930 [Phytoactinopolyspora halophila]
MPGLNTDPPLALPVLSRGKHRRPRQGACFMEFASYLAGERWSDHPACTHPLLSSLARMVNDTISDQHRPHLAHLIPSVIGLNDDDTRLDAIIVRRVAAAALPVVSAERQRVLAVAILGSERILDDLDGRPAGTLSAHSIGALDQVPDAARWARSFTAGMPSTHAGFRRHAGPTAIRTAVTGIAEACVRDTDRRLHDLLAAAVDECRAWIGADAQPGEPVDAAQWSQACQITGTATP